ncbi:hypothetical protein KJ819_01880 [Patescibacteria group bacterium]|nr:hypothetical protein [Patescibacteria group bacterium]MBU1500967.1 hypothetical protein [Patescibacteria group bacterium]MBU2080597.1 hypothetical protein [Patescibacteria group bacterium]MBU2124328.1 hypothetical protein [Patescibacteria group bacterium]MBU2194454.1 hypothetical protein [Patescibacteria group bacterium]
MTHLALVEKKRQTQRAFLKHPGFSEGDGPHALIGAPVRISPAVVHWLKSAQKSLLQPDPLTVTAIMPCASVPQQQCLTGDDLLSRVKALCSSPGTAGDPDLFVRLLLHDMQQPEVILQDNGQPNLLLVSDEQAIDLCYIGHSRGTKPYWDVDMVRLNGRDGKWAEARVIVIERRH